MNHDNTHSLSNQDTLAKLLIEHFQGRSDVYLSQLPDGKYIAVEKPITPGFVVYSDSELRQLYGGKKRISNKTLKLIHEAKKNGARL